MKTTTRMMLLALALSAVGCGRHVVVDPDRAQQLNSKDWTIKKAPRGAPAPGQPPQSEPRL
jgi:hypothetical protein